MKCIGCGVKIQTTNPNEPGFVSEIHIIENGEEVYCKRCYDIIHYNKRYIPIDNKQSLINKLKKTFQKNQHDVVCIIVDVLDIYGGINEKIVDIIGNMKTIILINKIDILPKHTNLIHLEESVRDLGLKLKLNVLGVYAISSKNETKIENVLRKIDKLRYNKYKNKMNFNNCYVLGYASVGKSTFINSVKKICGINNNPLTTSDQFQTTLDFIKIELGNKFSIYDTPGIVNESSFNYYLNYDSTKLLNPQRFLRVRVFQLNSGQTLFLGGLAQLDFIEGEKISVSLYVANSLYVHRTKQENAIKLKEDQKYKLLVPPLTEEESVRLGKTKTVEFTLDDNQFYDLNISGLGFIHIKGINVKFKLTIPEKIAYYLVESIL